MGPSLMPDYRFPAFRIYTYEDGTILDYTQYKANLTDIQLNDKIEYQKDYTFTEEYNTQGVETKDYHTLYEEIKRNATMYCSHYTPGRHRCETTNIIVHKETPPDENVELR